MKRPSWTVLGTIAGCLLSGTPGALGQSALTPELYLPLEEKTLLAIPAAGVQVTPRGTPVFADGKSGKALAIDTEGVSVSHVELKGADLMDPAQGTIAFWLRPLLDYTASSNRHYILSMTSSTQPGFSHYLAIEKDMACSFSTKKDGRWLESHFNFKWWNRPTWTRGLWYNIVVTWSPDQPVTFYVNGEKVHEAKPQDQGFSRQEAKIDRIVVGADPTGALSANALLDELAIYRDVLTPAQVKDLMTNGVKKEVVP